MRKKDERENPQSCFNRAEEDDFIFVLLDRDVATPGTIEDWANRRVSMGKNKESDKQIIMARHEAAMVRSELVAAGKFCSKCQGRGIISDPLMASQCDECGGTGVPKPIL